MIDKIKIIETNLISNYKFNKSFARAIKNIQSKNVEKTIVKKAISNQLIVLSNIIDLHLILIHKFQPLIKVKDNMGSVYPKNELIYYGLIMNYDINKSMILLIKNGLYGSARSLLRQSFELLLIIKYNFIDSSIFKKWSTKKDGKDSNNEISVTYNILTKLNKKNIMVTNLRDMYSQLCDYNHPTRYAQQLPIIIQNKENQNKIYANAQYTSDLIFMIQKMSLHLINLFHSQTRGFYLGYNNDPFGCEREIKFIKNELKKMYQLYPYNKKAFKKIKLNKVITEFKSSWN
jgi:hypothetical protein